MPTGLRPPMPDLSRRYGVIDSGCGCSLQKKACRRALGARTREQVEQIASLHRNGISAIEVLRRVGVPDSTVRVELTRLGSGQAVDKEGAWYASSA